MYKNAFNQRKVESYTRIISCFEAEKPNRDQGLLRPCLLQQQYRHSFHSPSYLELAVRAYI